MKAWRALRAPGTLTLALAACAPLHTPHNAAGNPSTVVDPVVLDEPAAPLKESPAPMEDSGRLLSYFERLKRLSGGELAKEHEAARLAYGRASTDFNRISYAMTLALPGTSFNDDARALELLNPLHKKTEGQVRALVLLLATFIQDRRRLGTDLAAVQQKLDALKSLERSLIERDQINPGRK